MHHSWANLAEKTNTPLYRCVQKERCWGEPKTQLQSIYTHSLGVVLGSFLTVPSVGLQRNTLHPSAYEYKTFS